MTPRRVAAAFVVVLCAGLAGCGSPARPVAPCSVPIVPVQSLDDPPRLIRLDPPVYPEIARQLGHEGVAVTELVVDWDGTVCEAAMAESSGYAELDQAAVDAARTALYAPIRRQGRLVRTTVRMPMRFSLNEPRGDAERTDRLTPPWRPAPTTSPSSPREPAV